MRTTERIAMVLLNDARIKGLGEPFTARQMRAAAPRRAGLKERLRFFRDWASAYRVAAPLLLDMGSNVAEADKEFQVDHPGGTALEYVAWVKSAHAEEEE